MITRKNLSGNDPRLIIIIKSADEIITSDSTPSTDGELQFNAKANTKYFVVVRLDMKSEATPDFQYLFTIPSLAVGRYLNDADSWNAGSTGSLSQDITNSIFTNFTSTIDGVQCANMGFIETGATAGVIGVQWSQQASNVAETILKKGSSLLVIQQ